jgi:HrpA-like RNA helicase
MEVTGKCSGKASDDVPQTVPKEQYNLVVSLIKAVGQPGTAVLVFVSGIADITELTERFENQPRYKLYAIHSDLPFEEQEQAFTPAGPDEVKVVVATNAAESR